jgi:hypothetical protein
MDISDRSRERRACDAVARCIECVANLKRANAFYPEENAKGRSAVDYAFDLGNEKYRFEHTVVEAFDGQLRMDEQFSKFIGPVEAALDYQLPKNAYFSLWFSIDPASGMKPKAVSQLQAEIIAWVKITANELVAEAAQTPRRSRRSPRRTMPGSNVALELHEDLLACMGGRLMAGRVAPRKYDELRIARVKQAVDRKLPKLADCRPASTVLVLENRDGALSNHWLISDCVEEAIQGRSDKPDEIWLVDAVHLRFWVVVCLHKGGTRFPYENAPVRHWEFDPAGLSAT